MDPENIGKEAIIRVTDWLRGIWKMKRNKGPVQQWVDSIPSPTKSTVDIQINCPDSPTVSSAPEMIDDNESIGKNPIITATSISVPPSPAITMTIVPSATLQHSKLVRDPSQQSDSSHCSSVESLLELRKADPEAILLGLGFGGSVNNSTENGVMSRIPKRFLQPSKLNGIVIEDFIKQQQVDNESIDSTTLGYRGLTGSPYVVPSKIVRKIRQCLLDHESQEIHDLDNTHPRPYPLQQGEKPSVLSPDNRQFLRQQRSKSPDMRNKRMIIGQKSFAFSGDGDLIEIQSSHSNSHNANGPIPYLDATLKSTSEDSISPIETVSSDQGVRSRKKIIKQKSIDDTQESEVHDLISSSNSSSIDCKLNSAIINSKESSRDTSNGDNISVLSTSTDIESSNCPRRASEGSCDISHAHTKLIKEERRRFSDGVISTNEKRRNFRRQARISESEYINSNLDITLTSAADDIDQQTDTAKCSGHLDTTEDIVNNSTAEQQVCSIIDKSNRICQHNTNHDCCSGEGSLNCFKNMRKILPKNQKIVAKNKKEMSEIRGMLSNVMSVRMEPGF